MAEAPALLFPAPFDAPPPPRRASSFAAEIACSFGGVLNCGWLFAPGPALLIPLACFTACGAIAPGAFPLRRPAIGAATPSRVPTPTEGTDFTTPMGGRLMERRGTEMLRQRCSCARRGEINGQSGRLPSRVQGGNSREAVVGD